MDSELIFDGKKYILASRAAKTFGYNPDYIGQMCRKGQLDCRMVGRYWFVLEESVLKHKDAAALSIRGTIKQVSKITNSEVPLDVSQTDSISKVSAFESTAVNSSSIPLPPRQLPRAVVEERGLAFFGLDNQSVGIFNPEPDESNRTNRRFSTQVATAFGAIIMFVLIAQFSLSNGFFGKEAFMNFSKSQSLYKSELFALARVAFGDPEKQSGQRVETVENSDLISSSVADSNTSYFKAQVVSALDYLDDKLKTLIGAEFVDRPPVSDKSSPPKEGFVVLPASNETMTTERVKQYVLESFSDEVIVEPDDDQQSGVIRPVFKNHSDQEYMYVMVPVK